MIEGTVICVINGKETTFSNVKELLDMSFDKKYFVSGISGREGNIVVSLKEDKTVPNDLSAEWAQDYMMDTGKEISFF